MLRRHETTISSRPQSLVTQLTLSVQPVPGRNDAGAAWGLFGYSDLYDAISFKKSTVPGSQNDKNQEKATWNIRQNTILETSGCSHTMKRLLTILLSCYLLSLWLIQTKPAHSFCNAFLPHQISFHGQSPLLYSESLKNGHGNGNTFFYWL